MTCKTTRVGRAFCIVILAASSLSAHWPWIEIESTGGATRAYMVFGLFREVRSTGHLVETISGAQFWIAKGGAALERVALTAGTDLASGALGDGPLTVFAVLDHSIHSSEGVPSRLLFTAKATSGNDARYIHRRTGKGTIEIVPTSTGLPFASHSASPFPRFSRR